MFRYLQSGKALVAMFVTSVIVMITSSFVLINAGPENSRVDFLTMEGHDLLSLPSVKLAYDFALADSVLTENIEFLERQGLDQGQVAFYGDLSKYYQELCGLRQQVQTLALEYPDSLSGNHRANEELKQVAKPVMAAVINFRSSWLLAHAMQHGLKFWSMAFGLSLLFFIYGLICWKQGRF
ncbi:MAG: hypothetical protein WCV71_03755 [Patescibacteria group bacterium]